MEKFTSKAVKITLNGNLCGIDTQKIHILGQRNLCKKLFKDVKFVNLYKIQIQVDPLR